MMNLFKAPAPFPAFSEVAGDSEVVFLVAFSLRCLFIHLGCESSRGWWRCRIWRWTRLGCSGSETNGRQMTKDKRVKWNNSKVSFFFFYLSHVAFLYWSKYDMHWWILFQISTRAWPLYCISILMYIVQHLLLFTLIYIILYNIHISRIQQTIFLP